MKRLLLLIASAIFLSSAGLQAKELEKFILMGHVIMADTTAWLPLDSLHVSISRTNDTIPVPVTILRGDKETGTATGYDMRIMVHGGRGSYVVTFDKDGYEPTVKDFKITSLSQDIFYIGSLQMRRERHRRLNEVEVRATAIKMVLKGDTIVYNADAFRLAEGSMLDALVRQLPGAELDMNGQIKVNGKFVNSLLLNGKDFFKGEPTVILQNLPAYTVQNIKVYDKGDDDDYLTNANASLELNPEERNLVMDVVLKREYSIGYLGNIEGGGGTQNRWIGRAFGMGYGDKWRVSAFVNCNNTNNTDEGSGTRRGWQSGWNATGETDWYSGGIDYSVSTDDDKFEASGMAIYSQEKYDNRFATSATSFYPGGDLYRRSDGRDNDLRRHLRSSHEFTYRADNSFFIFMPKVDWLLTDKNYRNREAVFTEMPLESSRIASLDSVFMRNGSRQLYDKMLTRKYSAGLSNPGWIGLYGDLYSTISPRDMRGRFRVTARGKYSRDTNLERNLIGQMTGGANVTPDVYTPSDRTRDDVREVGEAELSGGYAHSWTKMTDTKSTSLDLNTTLDYFYSHNYHNEELFMNPSPGEIMPSDPLPSLCTPENFEQNKQNSYRSILTDNGANADISLSFRHEPVAPTDSGINPSFSVYIKVTGAFRHKLLDYANLEPMAQRIVQRYGSARPDVSGRFSSSNRLRSLYVDFRYSMYTGNPDINSYLNVISNSNPLVIYENNASGLKRSHDHNMRITFSRWSQSGRRPSLYAYIASGIRTNAIGQASYYNPQTGVTRYTPRNINGNWDINGYVEYNISVGSRNQIRLMTQTMAQHRNSADYVTLQSEPIRSVVKSLTAHETLSATYQFKNGSTVSLRGSTSYNRGRSKRADFQNVDAFDIGAALNASVRLPWEMELTSDMDMQCRRGYNDASMNSTEWLWNASLSKSILKGKLLFKVSAYDILGQINPVSYRLNAQGRTETWTNTLPRYVMATVTYKFNHNPAKAR